MSTRKIKAAGFIRTMTFEDAEYREEDGETKSVELSFSSEFPVRQMFGQEVLDHSRKAVRLDRLRSVGPLLLDHDPEKLIGKVEKVEIKDRKGRAVVRFASTPLGAQTLQEVKEGIRNQISVGYRIHRMVLESTSDNSEEDDVYRVNDWEPHEISFVSVPADPTVGIGRQDDLSVERDITIEIPEPVKPEALPMDPKDKKVDVEIVEPKRFDESEVIARAQSEERERVTTIDRLGKRHNLAELANKAVEEGWPLEKFRAQLLEDLGDRAPLKPAGTPDIGLSRDEVNNFSFVKCFRALQNPNDIGAQKAAGFEFACSAAVAKIMRNDPTGLYVPSEVLRTPLDAPEAALQSAHRMMQNRWGKGFAQRDLLDGTTTAGGFTVATDVMAQDFIELLRNRMMVRQMGSQFISGLVGNVAFPSQTAGATAYWVAENVAITESQQTFGQLALAPETVGAFTDYSRRLLIQSSIDIEAFVRNDLATTLAIELDRAAINGSGSSNIPEGILNATGIGDVAGGTNGLAPTYAHMIELWSDVAVANADIGSTGFLTNAKAVGKLMTTDKGTDTGQFIVPTFPNAQGFTSLAGARCGVSNQVPSNLTKGSGTALSAIIYGNWADLIVATWGALELTLDTSTGATAGTRRIVALQDANLGLRHVASFSAMQDAITV